MHHALYTLMLAMHDNVYYRCIILYIMEINKQNHRSYLELALRSTNNTNQFKRGTQKKPQYNRILINWRTTHRKH